MTGDRAAWHEARSQAIGASEMAGILGCSPWASPLSVWVEKTGRGAGASQAPEVVERQRWGSLLEPVILHEYGQRAGLDVEHWPQDKVVRHPDWPAVPMSCTPDGTVVSPEPRANVQVKCSDTWVAKAWAGEIPLHVQVQVQAEMACREMSLSTVLVLLGGNRLEVFDIERDDELIYLMETEAARFWREHVEAKEAPAYDTHPATLKVLEHLHPDDNGETVQLPPESLQWWQGNRDQESERCV